MPLSLPVAVAFALQGTLRRTAQTFAFALTLTMLKQYDRWVRQGEMTLDVDFAVRCVFLVIQLYRPLFTGDLLGGWFFVRGWASDALS